MNMLGLQYQSSPSTPKSANKLNTGSADILKVLDHLPGDGVIRLFERNGNFEVYHEAAVNHCANILKLSSNIQLHNGDIPFLIISPANIATLFRALLEECRVEVWRYNSVRNSWKVVARASPGNPEPLETYLMENGSIGSSNANSDDPPQLSTLPLIASLVVGKVEEADHFQVGLTCIDLSRMSISWTFFPDTDTFSNINTALVQLDATECIYSSQSGPELKQLMDGMTLVSSPIPAAEFESDCCREDIRRLLKESDAKLADPLPTPVLKSITGLIKYLGLLNEDTNLASFSLSSFNITDYLRLDENALRSLHVFSRENRSTSLFGLLDNCKTRPGSKLLSRWLRQPLREASLINKRLDVVHLLNEASVQRQVLRENVLRGIPDISRVARRILRRRSSLQDLVNLYFACSKVAPIYEQLMIIHEDCQQDDIKSSLAELLLIPLAKLSNEMSKFAQMIETTVDFEALKRHEYLVRADYATNLTDLHAQRERLLDQMESEFTAVARKLGLEKGKKIKFERNSTYGHFLRISRLDGNVLSKQENEYQELAALKNGIYFRTSKLTALSLEYDEIGKSYNSSQKDLVHEMLEVAVTYKSVFEQLNDIIAKVDVLQALSHYTVTSPVPLVRPVFMTTESGTLHCKSARHPCVEAVKSSSFIPNDILIDHSVNMQIITGPNMGGKSTYIRQAALIVLMAQIGCFVPCQEATLSIFDSILVRVGAGDSLFLGMSTFMMEMVEMSSILRTATPHSLVLIDELGRGTSTSEGLGIAWAIAKELTIRGCSTLFATHFHELTTLAHELQGVRNLQAIAEIPPGASDVIMTYRITEGVAERSFGIEVARMAGFPDNVIDFARIHLAYWEGQFPLSEDEMRQVIELAERTSDPAALPDKVKRLLPSFKISD